MEEPLATVIREKLIAPLSRDPALREKFTKRLDRKKILFNFGDEPFFLRVYGELELFDDILLQTSGSSHSNCRRLM